MHKERNGRRSRVTSTCTVCQVVFSITPSNVERGRGKYCSPACTHIGQRGPNHPGWKGNRTFKHSAGYLNRYVAGVGIMLEHRRIMFAMLGPGPHPCHWCARPLNWLPGKRTAKGALTIDHLDNNRQNNDPTNLVVSCHQCNTRRARGLPVPKP